MNRAKWWECPDCGATMEDINDHTCDPDQDMRLYNAELMGDRFNREDLTEAQRLNLGFEMMNLDEEEEY